MKAQTKNTCLVGAFVLSMLLVLSFCNSNNEISNTDPWKLNISAPREEKMYFSYPVAPDDIFTITYIHSVSNSPVTGYFLITNEGAIKPISTIFSTYGPGLPVDDKGEILDDKSIKVSHNEEPRSAIRLWVSKLTEDKITIQTQTVNMSSWTDSALLLEIVVEK